MAWWRKVEKSFRLWASCLFLGSQTKTKKKVRVLGSKYKRQQQVREEHTTITLIISRYYELIICCCLCSHLICVCGCCFNTLLALPLGYLSSRRKKRRMQHTHIQPNLTLFLSFSCFLFILCVSIAQSHRHQSISITSFYKLTWIKPLSYIVQASSHTNTDRQTYIIIKFATDKAVSVFLIIKLAELVCQLQKTPPTRLYHYNFI